MTVPRYRLYSWSFSYFSGKVRAYLTHKARAGALEFEDILATPEIRRHYMLPATGTETVPQVEAPDGTWLEDSSHIIDVMEQRHPVPAVIPASPRQRLTAYLIELLADEWMLPYAYWQRWHYSLPSTTPNQQAYNAQQWGAFLVPQAGGLARREAGLRLFKETMWIDDPAAATVGPYAGLIKLGVTAQTAQAWSDSAWRIVGALEAHLDRHDYVFGGAPSLADFALFGPIHPHLYRDPVPGLRLRTEFPLVAEWAERVAGGLEAGMRSVHQQIYRVEGGRLAGSPASSDDGGWLADDRVPDAIMPILGIFFAEMWPVLQSSTRVLSSYLANARPARGALLPSKSFVSSAAFHELQTNHGPLTHSFEIGGVTGRRMVSAYHVWMLQRLEKVIVELARRPHEAAAVDALLDAFPRGRELNSLTDLLKTCRVGRERGQVVAL